MEYGGWGSVIHLTVCLSGTRVYCGQTAWTIELILAHALHTAIVTMC